MYAHKHITKTFMFKNVHVNLCTYWNKKIDKNKEKEVYFYCFFMQDNGRNFNTCYAKWYTMGVIYISYL